MRRKAIPEIVKKKLFQETGSKCPNCQEADVAALQIHHIQPLAQGGNDDEGNLIVLCSTCHSKVTAGEISEIDILRLKILLMKRKIPSDNLGSGMAAGGVVVGRGLHVDPSPDRTSPRGTRVTHEERGGPGQSGPGRPCRRPRHRTWARLVFDRRRFRPLRWPRLAQPAQVDPHPTGDACRLEIILEVFRAAFWFRDASPAPATHPYRGPRTRLR